MFPDQSVNHVPGCSLSRAVHGDGLPRTVSTGMHRSSLARIIALPRALRRRAPRRETARPAILAVIGYLLLGATAMSLAHRLPLGDPRAARVDAVAFACVGLLLHVLAHPYLPRWKPATRRQYIALALAAGCLAQWAIA